MQEQEIKAIFFTAFKIYVILKFLKFRKFKAIYNNFFSICQFLLSLAFHSNNFYYKIISFSIISVVYFYTVKNDIFLLIDKKNCW